VSKQQRYNSDKVESTTLVGLAISRGSTILNVKQIGGDHYVGGRDLYLGRAVPPPPPQRHLHLGNKTPVTILGAVSKASLS